VRDALIRSEIQLKCGKPLKNPSLFVELKTKRDGNLIKETVFRYPINKAHDGINQIDGFSIPIGNYSKIAPFLTPDIKSVDENHYSVNKRLCLIDPSLYFLFMGLDTDKENCCDLIDEWVPKISPIVKYIASLKLEKADQVIKQIYPLLDVVLIRILLTY
jgi:hypothetical protein